MALFISTRSSACSGKAPRPDKLRDARPALSSLFGGRYFMIFGGGALLAFGLPARPETSYVRAARDEAAKRLKEEGVI